MRKLQQPENYEHRCFRCEQWAETGHTCEAFKARNNDPFVDSEHGTGMAGLIVAVGNNNEGASTDALLVLKYAVGLAVDVNPGIADADCSGSVVATDALYVLEKGGRGDQRIPALWTNMRSEGGLPRSGSRRPK